MTVQKKKKIKNGEVIDTTSSNSTEIKHEGIVHYYTLWKSTQITCKSTEENTLGQVRKRIRFLPKK